MAAPARLLKLQARCPVCGSPPAVQVTQLEARIWKKLPAHWLVQTIMCHVCWRDRHHAVMYELHAKAYHGAA